MFFAVLAIFILPDFPSTSHTWLSPEEVRLAERRMEEDVGVGDEEQTEAAGQVHGLVLAFTDWKVWWLALALTSLVVSLSFNAFFPTLSATMGYNPTITLLLCAPPWVFATIVAFCVCRHSDKTRERFWHIAIPLCFGIVGFVIAISTMNLAARYISLCVFHSLRHTASPDNTIQVPHGSILCWIHRFPHMDQQLDTPPTIQACRCARLHQRLLTTRQHRRIVSTPPSLSSLLS